MYKNELNSDKNILYASLFIFVGIFAINYLTPKNNSLISNREHFYHYNEGCPVSNAQADKMREIARYITNPSASGIFSSVNPGVNPKQPFPYCGDALLVNNTTNPRNPEPNSIFATPNRFKHNPAIHPSWGYMGYSKYFIENLSTEAIILIIDYGLCYTALGCHPASTYYKANYLSSYCIIDNGIKRPMSSMEIIASTNGTTKISGYFNKIKYNYDKRPNKTNSLRKDMEGNFEGIGLTDTQILNVVKYIIDNNMYFTYLKPGGRLPPNIPGAPGGSSQPDYTPLYNELSRFMNTISPTQKATLKINLNYPKFNEIYK